MFEAFGRYTKRIDEQAQIDGCSTLGIIFRIILPLARPGIAAVAIYGFIMAWNDALCIGSYD